jgi:hypothetical protein
MARNFVLVQGSYTRYFGIVYVYCYWGSCQEKWRQILAMYRRAPDSSIEPWNRTVSIFNLIPPSQHLLERSNGFKIAQLHSQSKLTTPRWENKKIRHQNEISKANEPTPYMYVYKLEIYQLQQKTYYTIWWDYPFLRCIFCQLGSTLRVSRF